MGKYASKLEYYYREHCGMTYTDHLIYMPIILKLVTNPVTIISMTTGLIVT